MVITLRLSDLQNKDVVDITSGVRMGNVIDVEISSDTGNITKIIVYDKKNVINLFRGEEVSITWPQIKKIGGDVILVSRNT